VCSLYSFIARSRSANPPAVINTPMIARPVNPTRGKTTIGNMPRRKIGKSGTRSNISGILRIGLTQKNAGAHHLCMAQGPTPTTKEPISTASPSTKQPSSRARIGNVAHSGAILARVEGVAGYDADEGSGMVAERCERIRTDENIQVAPRAGFEPATIRLTVECSTAELPRNRRNRRSQPAAYNKASGPCKGRNGTAAPRQRLSVRAVK
jgi:hypothetical protein